jgi:hypothetical protein
MPTLGEPLAAFGYAHSAGIAVSRYSNELGSQGLESALFFEPLGPGGVAPGQPLLLPRGLFLATERVSGRLG